MIDAGERIGDAVHLLGVKAKPRVEAEADILCRGEMREEVVVLEQDRERTLRRRQVGKILTGETNAPGDRHGKAGNGVQQRRLAAAGRTDESAKRACRNGKVVVDAEVGIDQPDAIEF
jgi:hypothetical protein